MAEGETPQSPFDAQNLEGLQADIMKTLKEHGIEPGHMPAVDISKIPGMSRAHPAGDGAGEGDAAGVARQPRRRPGAR